MFLLFAFFQPQMFLFLFVQGKVTKQVQKYVISINTIKYAMKSSNLQNFTNGFTDGDEILLDWEK